MKRGPVVVLRMAARAQEVCVALGILKLIFGGLRQTNYERTYGL